MSTEEADTRTRILAATWRLMEERRGQGVRMADIAAEAGVSRQALYLHFRSRAELLVATTHYGDRMRGLGERLRRWREATRGVDLLDEYVAFWGNYIPEIYGIARALMATRDTDEDAAVAWNERMSAVRDGCRTTIEALQRDDMLTPEWTCDTAVDLFWTLLSIRGWEQLTAECGWSTEEYIRRMKRLAFRTFVRSSPEEPAAVDVPIGGTGPD